MLYRVTQQPLVQELPGQQGVAVEPDGLGVPHTTHRFDEVLHMVFAAVQLLPVQQGAPAVPQAWQVDVLLLHAVPGSLQAPPVVELEQQDCPVPPHNLHNGM